jgi:hypothetical protein
MFGRGSTVTPATVGVDGGAVFAVKLNNVGSVTSTAAMLIVD